MYRRILFAIVAILLLTNCRREEFVPDPNDKRLPQYTEEGNMIGGALVNEVAWRTRWERKALGEYKAFYFTNYATGDSVTLDLQGKFIEGPMKEREFDFLLVLNGIQVKHVSDLIALEGRTFSLDGQKNYVIVNDYTDRENNSIKVIKGGIGTFSIKRTREVTNQIYYRGSGQNKTPYHPLIVAGTFEFEFPAEGIKVESGRYDFFINDDEVIQK